MPFTHARNFRIRYYECDANGHLNNANYLRFMQETATDASTAGGYGEKKYTEMNRYWLIFATQVEYLLPAFTNDTVQVKTWVTDFRRASSRRSYEFTRLETNELIARAYTDWIFLNASTHQPSTIPAELGQAFYPEGLPESFPPRQPFPKAPAPPPGVYKMRLHVTWQDIDSMQHVNNANYLNYVSECGFQAVAAHDWSWERMKEEGFAIFLRRIQIQYLGQAKLGDELEIATWVSDVKRSTAMRHYTITRISDGALLTRAHTLGVWVDLATLHPVRIPVKMLEDFSTNIV